VFDQRSTNLVLCHLWRKSDRYQFRRLHRHTSALSSIGSATGPLSCNSAITRAPNSANNGTFWAARLYVSGARQACGDTVPSRLFLPAPATQHPPTVNVKTGRHAVT